MWQAIRDFMAWYQATIVIWVTIPIFTILLPWGDLAQVLLSTA